MNYKYNNEKVIKMTKFGKKKYCKICSLYIIAPIARVMPLIEPDM